jgi:curli biogenesis system outer membrane secretion channel CsgG
MRISRDGISKGMVLGALLLSGCGSPPPPLVKPQAALAGDLKKRIAVVDFIDKTDYGKGRLGISCTDILEGELTRSGRFTMVSHSGSDEVLNLQAAGQSGIYDPATVVAAGRMVGANAIINGSVSEFGIKKGGVSIPGVIGTKSLSARAVVDITLIDGTSGVILLSETGVGEAETTSAKVLNIGTDGSYDETLAGKALRAAIEQLVGKITAKMEEVPWQGYILSVEGGEAWITGGQDVNIRPGMAFTVTAPPRTVTAPNGKTYSLPGPAKATLQVAQALEDVSRARLLSGAAEKNDPVRLTAP